MRKITYFTIVILASIFVSSCATDYGRVYLAPSITKFSSNTNKLKYIFISPSKNRELGNGYENLPIDEKTLMFLSDETKYIADNRRREFIKGEAIMVIFCGNFFKRLYFNLEESTIEHIECT